MLPGIIASLVGNALRGIVPRASLVGQFLRILLEIEAGSDQTIGDRPVRGIVGKVHLIVSQKRPR